MTIAVFAFFALRGYYSAENYSEMATGMLEEFRNEMSFILNAGPVAIFFIILINNSVKTFLFMLSGFLFGLPPFLLLAFNGIFLGIVANIVSKSEGWRFLLAGIIPHGIFEIPAIILSMNYGLWLGHGFYRKLRFKEPFREKLSVAIRFFSRIILPLLIIAAIVEAFITPAILDNFL